MNDCKMTKNKALELALEALQLHAYTAYAIAAVKEALAEPQHDCGECDVSFPCHSDKTRCIRQEPVMYKHQKQQHGYPVSASEVPLHTTPPQHTWVGLTDEEVGKLTVFDGLHHIETPLLAGLIRAVETKLKEKNHA